jgi:hypothetical protein
MTDKRYSKIEEEIIEILDQMDDVPAPEQPSNLVQFRPRSKPKRPSPPRPQLPNTGLLEKVRRYSSGSWVGVGIVAAILAWQLGRFLPILGVVGMFLAIGAFLAALYTRQSGSVSGIPSTSSTSKRWRGRDIDLPPAGSRQRKTRWWNTLFKGPRSR